MPLENGHIKEDTQFGGFRFSSRLVVWLVGLSVNSRLTNQLLICGVVFSPLGCRWYLLDSATFLEVSVCESEYVCACACVCYCCCFGSCSFYWWTLFVWHHVLCCELKRRSLLTVCGWTLSTSIVRMWCGFVVLVFCSAALSVWTVFWPGLTEPLQLHSGVAVSHRLTHWRLSSPSRCATDGPRNQLKLEA